MSLCLAGAALALGLALPDDRFTLRWTHSVERTEWVEHWRIEGHTLVLDDARVRGSGAGMEPPEGSVLRGGWWVYRADRRLPELRLAASGTTGRGWQLCTAAGGCADLEAMLTLAGQRPEQVLVWAGEHCRRPLAARWHSAPEVLEPGGPCQRQLRGSPASRTRPNGDGHHLQLGSTVAAQLSYARFLVSTVRGPDL